MKLQMEILDALNEARRRLKIAGTWGQGDWLTLAVEEDPETGENIVLDRPECGCVMGWIVYGWTGDMCSVDEIDTGELQLDLVDPIIGSFGTVTNFAEMVGQRLLPIARRMDQTFDDYLARQRARGLFRQADQALDLITIWNDRQEHDRAGYDGFAVRKVEHVIALLDEAIKELEAEVGASMMESA